MITESPNPEDVGKILKADMAEELIELRKRQNPFGNKPIAELLVEKERQALETVAQQERPALLREMRSKNKSAQRRAKKKIANASRRRNRK